MVRQQSGPGARPGARDDFAAAHEVWGALPESPLDSWDSGPWMTTAFFCERVIEDSDGVPSYVRVVDEIEPLKTWKAAPHATNSMIQGVYPTVFMVVSVLAGSFDGDVPVTIRAARPTYEAFLQVEARITLGRKEGADSRYALHVPIEVQPREYVSLMPPAGLHGFDVFFWDRHMVRTTLDVVTKPRRTPAPR